VGKDEESEGYKEMSCKAGCGKASRKELVKSREVISGGDVSI